MAQRLPALNETNFLGLPKTHFTEQQSWSPVEPQALLSVGDTGQPPSSPTDMMVGR